MEGMCSSKLTCVHAYLLHNLEVITVPLFFHKYLYVSAFHFGLKYVIYHSKYTLKKIPWQTLPNDYFYQLFQILEEIMSFKKNPNKL